MHGNDIWTGRRGFFFREKGNIGKRNSFLVVKLAMDRLSYQENIGTLSYLKDRIQNKKAS